jgi:hypothetical protein
MSDTEAGDTDTGATGDGEDGEQVEEQWVGSHGLDAGSGSESLQLGEDWVAYLVEFDIPANVSGIDESIEDFETEGAAGTEGTANV